MICRRSKSERVQESKSYIELIALHEQPKNSTLPEIRVILRHEYCTSIKTVLENGSPMLQRNVWTLQQNLIFCQFKSNSACRPLIDKLYVTELRSKRFFLQFRFFLWPRNRASQTTIIILYSPYIISSNFLHLP